MITLAVIYKQKLLHENEIAKYIHNCKCYGVSQIHFIKPLQSSAKTVKNNYPKTTR